MPSSPQRLIFENYEQQLRHCQGKLGEKQKKSLECIREIEKTTDYKSNLKSVRSLLDNVEVGEYIPTRMKLDNELEDVWYFYHEGFSNAVRFDVTTAHFRQK